MSTTVWALALERRLAVLVSFHNLHLDDVLCRSLPEDTELASQRLTLFLKQQVETRRIEFVVLETPRVSWTERMQKLFHSAKDTLRSVGIPLEEVELGSLLNGYGHPPLRRREELRKAAWSIWPSLQDLRAKRSGAEAAALGLHLQIGRLFGSLEERA